MKLLKEWSGIRGKEKDQELERLVSTSIGADSAESTVGRSESRGRGGESKGGDPSEARELKRRAGRSPSCGLEGEEATEDEGERLIRPLERLERAEGLK